MAHFSYIRGSLGAWAAGTIVTQGEFWSIDESIYKSINGDDGGTWAPAAAVEIGGAGITMAGTNHEVTGTLSIESGAELTFDGGSLTGVVAGNPQATGTWTFQTQITMAGTLQSGGGTISGTWAGGPTWSGNHTFSGTVTFSGDPVFSGDPDFPGDPDFTGTPSFAGFDLTAPVSTSGTGRVRQRYFENATDGNRSLSLTSGDHLHNPNGVFSLNRAWTIGNGVAAGDVITITNADTSYNLTITATGWAGPVLRTASGYCFSAELIWSGSAWVTRHLSYLP
jgi:hypothetical protein